MDKINYLSNPATTQTGVFPITIQGMEFIQSQIMLLQNLAFCGGDYYVIKEPATNPVQSGIIVWAGEVLPLSGVKANFVQISVTKTNITTDSGEYNDARETRVAKYVTKADGMAETADLKKRTSFKNIKTNVEIWAQVEQLLNAKAGLPVLKGIYTQAQLNEQRTAARLHCIDGSAKIYGYTQYTIDVYECQNNVVYQEATTRDLKRFGRYCHFGEWGNWEFLANQFTIEGKLMSGRFYIKHGFLPPYANIILLRKKRRGRYAGRKDGARRYRPIKNTYYHGYRMILTQGTANKWYIPKVQSIETPKNAPSVVRGRDFDEALNDLLFVPKQNNAFYIRGVKKRWKAAPKRAYAKLALAVVASNTQDVGTLHKVRLKYRVWRHKNADKTFVVKKCLSVE